MCLIGAAIGLNSALIAIVTDWLSDIKLGYCSTGWWLNQKFCCWEIEEHGKRATLIGQRGSNDWNIDGGCANWTTWSEATHLGDAYAIKWFFYVLWAVSS